MKIKQNEHIEGALRDTEELNQTILDHALDALISMNDAGNIISWNKGAESIFGWEANEIIGKKFFDVILPSRYVNEHHNSLETYLTTGENRDLSKQKGILALHRFGHEFPIELSISTVKWEGRNFFFGVIRDITKRKYALELTRLRDEEYKTLLEVTKALRNNDCTEDILKAALIAITNSSQLNVESYSKMYLVDENKNSLQLFSTIGKFPKVLSNTEKEFPYKKCVCWSDLKKEEFFLSKICLTHPGHERHFREFVCQGGYIVPLKNGNKLKGVMVLYIKNNSDLINRSKEILFTIGGLISEAIENHQCKEKVRIQIQEISQVNQKLKELNELKNKFLGIASHDLRNPVYLIQSFSQILLDSSFGNVNKKQKALLGKIFKSSEFMKALLDNLLDISKIETGKIYMERKEHDLNQIIQDQTELIKFQADKKNIAFHFNLGKIPRLVVDKNAMIQVINNLIGNAIKYSPQDTQIYISTENRGNQVQLSIRDEGPGISNEEQPLLFEEFKTLSAKPTGGELSTGLGLAIVKKLVNLHEGEVGVYSHPGNGSTFYFNLPIKQPELVVNAS